MFLTDGKEISRPLDNEPFIAGNYYVRYIADSRLASGVYFYQMIGWTNDGEEIFIDTKKMVLLK